MIGTFNWKKHENNSKLKQQKESKKNKNYQEFSFKTLHVLQKLSSKIQYKNKLKTSWQLSFSGGIFLFVFFS